MENLYHYTSSTEPKGPDFGHDSSFVIPWSSSSSITTASSSSSAFQFCGFPNSVSIIPIKEDKATAASKSHSQAEKRRRDKINAHLSTLRKFIPTADKMDKAALLGSVIEQVKDLERKALEIGKSLTVPSEVDEIIIDNNISDQDMNLINNNNNEGSNNDQITTCIRASVCCDDRPELFSELIKVLNGLRLTAVSADVASIGGRIKSVLILSPKDCDNQGQGVSVNALRQSLKSVLTKIASQSTMATSNCRPRSKRQRFFLPSHCTDHHQ